MRMIQMLAELIAGILGLIKKGDYDLAAQSLDRAYNDLLKRDAGFFLNIPTEDLTGELLREHNFTNGHLEILSELFFAQGELSHAQGKEQECVEYYRKSLVLLDFVLEESNTYSMDKLSRQSYLRERTGGAN